MRADGAVQPTTFDTEAGGRVIIPSPVRGPGSRAIPFQTGPRRVGDDALRMRYRCNLGWERRLVAAVVGVDLAAILAGSLLPLLVPFRGGRPLTAAGYLGVTGIVAVLWIASMWLSRAYEARFLGVGSEEFKRTCNAALRLTAAIATVSYALSSTAGRRQIIVALPIATVLALAGRYGVRKVLVRLRRRGRYVHRVIVVGGAAPVSNVVRAIRRAPQAGMRVVGCCLDSPEDARPSPLEGVPVLGDVTGITAAINAVNATAVAVTASDQMSSAALRELSWQLEGTGVDLLVAPTLADVAGPRIHIRPVAELPLLHVEEPELSGGRRLLKGIFDRTIALVVLVLVLPVLAAVAVAVRLSSPGTVLFRQVRVGKDGRPFMMYKFRSMYADAETRLDGLLVRNERRDGLLFKIRQDPRVTRVGRLLRRSSVDELPQLFNVLRGDMSLVGPRPPLPSEVARYPRDVRRRLLVKPGLTGLWQVSGRSDLTWEESVRLDLHYVENWSLALDFMIVWKTAFAVFRAEGAY